MTKIGNKGFTLVEVVVVSVVIITVLISLFIGLSRVISAFDKRSRYYDIDALYIATDVNKMLLKTNKMNGLIKTEVDDRVYLLNDDTYPEIINICNAYSPSHVNAYFVLYNGNEFNAFMNNITNSNSNATFEEYLNYLNSRLNFSDDYTYMIIVEIQKSLNDCYYYALKVR